MSNLKPLASLLARRNAIDEKIVALIDRPAIRGHIGEWIAQEIFKVKLAKSANRKGFDGRFAGGPLAEKTVNVKWYGKCEGLLDINPDGVPDYYLVMTGPKAWPTKSRPLVITGVFLFDAHELVNRLRERGVRLGVATGVRQHEWAAARVYPAAAPRARLTLTDAQREALKLFAETKLKRFSWRAAPRRDQGRGPPSGSRGISRANHAGRHVGRGRKWPRGGLAGSVPSPVEIENGVTSC